MRLRQSQIVMVSTRVKADSKTGVSSGESTKQLFLDLVKFLDRYPDEDVLNGFVAKIDEEYPEMDLTHTLVRN